MGKAFPAERPGLRARLDRGRRQVGEDRHRRRHATPTATPTVTLKQGKPVTLQNTADGTRYELVLVTVDGLRRRLEGEEVLARLRSEEGFGLIELLISIAILNVAILALVARLQLGSQSRSRAPRRRRPRRCSPTSRWSSTARSVRETSRSTRAARHDRDAETRSTPATRPTARLQSSTSCSGSPPAECNPRQTVHGPGRPLVPRRHVHRRRDADERPRPCKRVTRRRPQDGHRRKALVLRLTSTFDASTG